MRIFLPLLLALTVIPVAELALLLTIGEVIGLVPTIGLVIGTGLLGASLARAEGLKTFFAFQKDAAAGRVPAGPLADGAMILVAAAFLVTPGVMTDAVGFSLLIPPIRAVLKKALGRAFKDRVKVTTFGDVGPFAGEPRRPDRPDVIDAEFDVRDE